MSGAAWWFAAGAAATILTTIAVTVAAICWMSRPLPPTPQCRFCFFPAAPGDPLGRCVGCQARERVEP